MSQAPVEAAPSIHDRRTFSPWIWAILGLLAAGLMSVVLGPVSISTRQLAWTLLEQIEPDWITGVPAPMVETILFQIRLPNMILLALAGMALAGSGAAYQGLFRNPLASPYVIGVAAGAGLGAVVAMAFQWPETFFGMALIPVAAFIGAMITVAVVYAIARVGRSAPVTSLILAGVAVSSFATALTSMIMILSTSELHRAVNWLVGGFSLGGWKPVLVSLPYIVLSLGCLWLLGRQINVLQFGEDQSRQLGLPVERVQLLVLAAASLAAATAVAFSGIIAFVGLIVPHFVRLLWGGDYRRLIPLATIVGGGFLLWADIVARTVMAPRQLPVGIVTALVGAPFFLWLLFRSKSRLSP